MMHDQSFLGPSCLSVNKRVQEDKLPPCIFGFCLLRILHCIVHTRKGHPTTKILIEKYDLTNAYRRTHLATTTALESLMMLTSIIFLTLWMAFGGAPCPAKGELLI